MKIKNLISIFVVLMLFASTATAQTSGSCGDYATWTYDTETQILTISGRGAMTDYTSSTSMPWVNFKDDIQAVVINQGITNIGKYAFSGCANLNSIIIPDGVTTISGVAFCNCSNLTSVTIPESVTTIGLSAFKNCTSLSISIPKTVTTIEGKNTFLQVESIEYHGEATPPDGYPAWGAFSFNGSSFIFADNEKTILQYYIGKGGDIVVPEGVTTIGVEDEKMVFRIWNVATTIIFPESVTTINGIVTFDQYVKRIYFKNDPDKLTWDCSKEKGGKTVYCYVSPQTIDIWEKKFSEEVDLGFYFVPNGVEFEQNGVVYILSEDGSATVKGYTASIPNELVIPSTITKDGVNYGVTKILQSAFQNCTKLTSVNIPDGVTTIRKQAFYGCHGLTSINIPESVTSIGEGAIWESKPEMYWHASPDVFKSVIFSSNTPQIHVPAESLDAFNEKYGSKYNFVGDIKKISNNDITIPAQTYTGTALTPVVKDGEKTLVEGEDYTITLPEGGCTNVGEYTVTITGKKLYYKSAEKTFTIAPAPVTVTADDKSKIYGESDPEFTATVTGLVNNESPDLITYTLTRAEGENVGEYTITPKGDEKQGNYVVSFVDATLTITKATPKYTLPVIPEQKCNATLNDITLPEGFAFAPNSEELTIGENILTLFYNPDENNYETVTGIKITITVKDH